jgi:hypothetical protein
MKKLLITLILFLSINKLFSQSIDTIVDKRIDAKITTFSNTLYEIVEVAKSTAGTFYIDTLTMPNNSTALFQLALKGYSTPSKPSALKYVVVSNTAGVYKVERTITAMAFAGLTNGAFDVVIVNNQPLVKITGTTAIINWTLTEIEL